MTASKAACSPKVVIPKLTKDMAIYGAASAAVRHWPAMGASSQDDVFGSRAIIEEAVMVFARLRGLAVVLETVAHSARSMTCRMIKFGVWMLFVGGSTRDRLKLWIVAQSLLFGYCNVG